MNGKLSQDAKDLAEAEMSEFEQELVQTQTTIHTIAGASTVARYVCDGKPDRLLVNGNDCDDKDALTILSGVFGRKVVFGKERKKKAE
jgi:hypothetical protein